MSKDRTSPHDQETVERRQRRAELESERRRREARWDVRRGLRP